ncbi:hypothetical protein [Mammaliicoccus sciuri]|uniref:hypothetical protein n=1 Tax=Mammaliicoccus sciuri TaxID=1296 RepID=UPI0005E19DA6|nr:hypothetical protein [Mammaliicoccus sciuri]MEB7846341.1 hypothetical protein [Mammaliicoccus sciuri]CPQ83187.1 Uncharacterised protein [Staphylococcus aureus]
MEEQRYLFEDLREVLKYFEHADVVKAIISYETHIEDVLTLNRLYREYMEDETCHTFLNDRFNEKL